jgi:hypothetical protein
MVENILAFVRPVPYPVKSINKKHINPPIIVVELPKVFYKLLPKANLI